MGGEWKKEDKSRYDHKGDPRRDVGGVEWSLFLDKAVVDERRCMSSSCFLPRTHLACTW